VNDDNRLSERLEILRTAVSRTPSMLEGVMGRISDAPEPLGRGSRWKRIAVVCLATAACAAVSIAGWMIAGGDTAEIASHDDSPPAAEPVKTIEKHLSAATEHELAENDRFGDGATEAERSRAEVPRRAAEAYDVRQEECGLAVDSAGENCGLHKARCAGVARPEPQLGDFAGVWHGTATDKPEDGTSTDPIGVQLAIDENGQLEGFVFERFADGGRAPLEDVYVVGDRLEFKVRHRTGVQMQVTLGLADETLRGDGIPIRSDEDRCDITLKRSEQEDDPNGEGQAASAKAFDGRWIGVVKNKPGRGDFRHSMIVDVSVKDRDGAVQVITMGDYQHNYDDHIDDAKVRNGKLVFRLMDRHGVEVTVSLWSQPGEMNRLWGECDPQSDEAPVRIVELKRTDGPREYDDSGEYRRLILDPAQSSSLPAAEGTGVR